MKIGIIGWYGHQNIGDERILSCLQKSLLGHDLFVVGGWDKAIEFIDKLNRCDYVLIGGGGLILRGCSSHIGFIERLKVPFSCVGISVEAEHSEMRPFLDLLKERAEKIIVRDANSERIFGQNHKIEIAPDLTFLQPLDVVSPVAAETCGINLRPWFFWKAQLHGYFHRFMVNHSKRFPKMIDYYPLKKWIPDQIIPEMERNFSKLVPIPFYFEEGIENDESLMKKIFPHVPLNLNALCYDGLKYFVGMRFHSVVFALQSGVPFISLSYQPKNNNFCRDLGLDPISVDIFKWRENLPQSIEYLKSNYKSIRQLLLERRHECVVHIRKTMINFFSNCFRK